MNAIKSIKSAATGEVRIELVSATDIPVRDAIVQLRIDNQIFQRSEVPADGSLKGITFIVSANDFAQLRSGAQVEVGFSGEPAIMEFGRLDKSQIDQ